jgi:hypothetical protein
MLLISKALAGSQVDVDFAPAGVMCRLLVEMDALSELNEENGEMSRQQ